jgi:glycosyltransferase involved in cell wall biosynthesis
MKATFLYHGGWRNPFAGAARPFISWTRELGGMGHDVSMALIKPGPRVVDYLKKEGIAHTSIRDTPALARHLRKERPEIVVADDNYPQLRITSAIRKRLKLRTATYIQMLFGTNSILGAYDTSRAGLAKRITLGLSRLVPFALFRMEYSRLLRGNSAIVCNSNATASMLQTVYGIEPDGVTYPPVDRSVFRRRGNGERSGALLFAGSYGWDTDERLIRRITGTLCDAGEKVTVFGNQRLGQKLAAEYKIANLDGCSDEELAEAYSRAKLAVCPQKWEMFGYVTAESVCCGTPVLAFNCMGSAEILSQTGGGVLVNRKEEFIAALEDVDAAAARAAPIRQGGFGFDSRRSAADLAAGLERRIGGGG